MTVPPNVDWPLAPRDTDWNGSDARRRVVDFYTKDDVTDWDKVHKCFMHYYPDKAELKTGHNLGFVDIIGGEPKAVDHGIFAVAGGHGVQSLDGIPADEKTKIKKRVNSWYAKMKKKWPNDDFDFDPPFPEVKVTGQTTRSATWVEVIDLEELEEIEDMPEQQQKKNNRLKALQAEYESVKAQLKSHLEQKFMTSSAATTFADLAAVDAIWETIDKVFSTVWDFQYLAENVAWSAESPEEMLKAVKNLAVEMTAIFTKMAREIPQTVSEIEQTEGDKALTQFINTISGDAQWEIKQGQNSALLKNASGSQFFYGRFTNNIWDKEDEVLISDAHEEFAKYLDDHPEEAPWLWDWHEEETQKGFQAVWWDYSDGFFHMIWPVTSDEAKGIEDFMGEFTPGMSHGFSVLKRLPDDTKQIALYRTFEASILPLEFAANEWTTFDMLKEKENKMFSPEKERALELLSLGKYIKPLGKASEADASALDQAGAQRKDKETMSDDKTKTVPETPVMPDVTKTAPVTKEDMATIDALQASIVEGFDLLSKTFAARFEKIEQELKAHRDALKGIKDTKGQSPSVAAWVAAQKAGTATGASPQTTLKDTDTGEVFDNDPLFGDAPEEEPYELDGHLLADY